MKDRQIYTFGHELMAKLLVRDPYSHHVQRDGPPLGSRTCNIYETAAREQGLAKDTSSADQTFLNKAAEGMEI